MDNAQIVSSQFELTPIQQNQFSQLKPLYEDWNSKINVISRKNMDRFYTEHVLHSLGIAKVLNFKSGTEVLDVGTGGGFPGIPLAILFPKVNFHLVDSVGKKIKVVRAVIENLGLSNVKASNERAEQVEGQYDFIVSRAVAKMKPFYLWIQSKVMHDSFNDLENGILFLKGGDLTDEINRLGRPSKEIRLSDYFDDPFFETKKIIHIAV